MAYSEDLRERVIAYLKEGHTQEETREIYKVGVSTIKRWLALLSETGKLAKRPLERSPRIYETEKLKVYVEENPNALLKEIASHFGGSISGADSALKREKITLKKRDILQRER
jgi:transposase